MLSITINKINKSGSLLTIGFRVPDVLRPYFNTFSFYAEYSQNIEDVSDSICIIPLMVQLLPIAWILDLEIEVDEIDEKFYNSIPDFKKGYQQMYPMIEFKGKIKANRITKNNQKNNRDSNDAATFFSGGIDAFATLIAHREDHPDLITVRGSDIHTNDDKGWGIVTSYNQHVADKFGLRFLTIESNFTEFLNQTQLNTLVAKSGDNWWHGFQHGIGLIGLSAPLAWVNGYNTVYIASSFTARDKVTCASYPTIDNYIAFCGAKVIHDQFEYNRFQKTEHILRFCEANNMRFKMRVCYHDLLGDNCCKCEKCIRSAVAIALLGYNPEDYGFKNPEKIFRNSRFKALRRMDDPVAKLWEDMQAEAIKIHKLPKGLKWIRTTNIAHYRKLFIVRILNRLGRICKPFGSFLNNL